VGDVDDDLMKEVDRQKKERKAQEDLAGFLIGANDVISRAVPWLIENFLVRGALNSIQGLPDSGKTWLSLALVAAVASGGVFPGNDGQMIKVERGPVLHADFDDVLEYTIKPRLEMLGLKEQDFDNITFIKPNRVTFSDSRVAAAFKKVRPALAVFDTLQHFLGAGVDMWRANETTDALKDLQELAEKYNTAVLVIQHINKSAASGNTPSVGWAGGSIGINGLFRSVWTVGKIAREGDAPFRSAVLPAKTNLLAIKPSARLFDLIPGRGFLWAGSDGTVTPSDLVRGDVAPKERGRPATARNDAESFLLEVLADGDVKSDEVKALAKERGISWEAINRAKPRAGVRSYKVGPFWYMKIDEELNNEPFTEVKLSKSESNNVIDLFSKEVVPAEPTDED
jgi:hypothetical protein